MLAFIQYLFEWSDCVYVSVPFLVAIYREWKVLDGTVISAQAALQLPADDPSRDQIAVIIDGQQRRAFWVIRCSLLVFPVLFYYLAPR